MEAANLELAEQCSEIALVSPLLEPAEGDILPDVISIDNAQLCNDATILGRSPLSVRMPVQQWAYGLIIPINASSVPKDINALTIQIHVSVQHGEIGVAVVDESLSTLVSIERLVGVGQRLVTLTIREPKKGKAVFLRTTSRGFSGPEMVILSTTARGPAMPRLVARQHGLNFDLIVICSPPKTATQTVESTIRAIHPSADVRRLHYISQKTANRQKELNASNLSGLSSSLINQAREADRVRHEIEMVRALGGSIAVIVGTREPIDRAIAGMFQSLPDTMPFYAELRRVGGAQLSKLLYEVMISSWRDEEAMNSQNDFGQLFGSGIASLDHFFRDEFMPLTGIDVLHLPIDRYLGYTILSAENLSVLIYRFEDIQRGLAPGLSALLNCTNLRLVTTNTSSEKPYADFYWEFRSSIKVPRDLCRAIYRSEYVCHLYSESEIAAFISRWSSGNSN